MSKKTDKQRFIDFADLMGYKVLQESALNYDFVFYTDKEKGENISTCGYDYIEFFGVFFEDGRRKEIFNISHVKHGLPGYEEYINLFSRLCPDYYNYID